MASMSLAGVLACFMGNDMGCDYFFWLLLAEWFGLVRCSSWSPLLPSVPEVFAGVDRARCRLHPSVYGRLWKNLPYLAVIVAVFGCCQWCTIGFSGRCLGRNGWFDSGYMFCVSYERLFGESHTFSMMRRLVFCSVVSVLTQNGEVCSADSSVYGLSRAAHTWKPGQYFYDDRGCSIFERLFGVGPQGQCTGTGPCMISLSDLLCRGAFVVIRLPSR